MGDTKTMDRPSPCQLLREKSVGRVLLKRAAEGGFFYISWMPPLKVSPRPEDVPVYETLAMCEYTVKAREDGERWLVGRWSDGGEWQPCELANGAPDAI